MAIKKKKKLTEEQAKKDDDKVVDNFKPALEALAANLKNKYNITDDGDKEEYLLTSDEERRVIEHSITEARKHYAWRRITMFGQPEETVKLEIAQKDWLKEIDRDEVLKRANTEKNYQEWQKKNRKLEVEKYQSTFEELQKKCTARYMFNVMAWTSKYVYGRNLVQHDGNKQLITLLCYYLSNDKKFETFFDLKGKPYSLQKGLLIRGVCGLGKTYLMQCVANNELNPVQLISMLDVVDIIKRDGDFTPAPQRPREILDFDDVGSEEAIVTHYGTKINWFKNFIEQIYFRNKIFNKLIISTNDNFETLSTKYGYRVVSRMREMFNVIDVEGRDMRLDN